MGRERSLSPSEMATELGFSRRTVYRWIHDGVGPRVFRSPGGHIRIRWADFIEWAKAHDYYSEGNGQ
ncbi:helix-turn-helix transcriptional regulator [Nocardiopsis sediminis]|uniref:Helix-turn-helix transcriptional regulator n=1 Tax=Nocardiopsis sediminis TaxID=1778267 RepID=A0ABV8FHL8_9ACTN